MDQPDVRSSSPSASEDSEGESKSGDTQENGMESEEENSKGEAEDSSSSDSEGSGEDDSEHSVKSEPGDPRHIGEGIHGGEYNGDDGGGGGHLLEDEGLYPITDLPLEVITTVEPTNYAYPVLKNMSNGVLTHRNIFTEAERSVLVGIINKYRNIVDTRSRTREIYLEKQNVWQQIVEEYNSTENIMVRTEKELRKCWDNMKYRAKQAEKEMTKMEVKVEDELEMDIKAEPVDNDTFTLPHSDYEAVHEEAWHGGEVGVEEEREPALKKARQESPKLSSLLLAAAHKRSPTKKTNKSSNTTTSGVVNKSNNVNNNNFPYSIPSCTKVMHVKKKAQSNTASGISSQEIHILHKGLTSCLSITNIPNPSGTLPIPGRESASPGTSPVQASIKPMPNLKKMVPSKHQHSIAKNNIRPNKKSNGLSSKAKGHSTIPAPDHPPSPMSVEAEGEERVLSSRLVMQRLQLEQREHEMRMRLLEKELQAHNFQSQYWSLRLKLLRTGREIGGGGLNFAGATNGDID